MLISVYLNVPNCQAYLSSLAGRTKERVAARLGPCRVQQLQGRRDQTDHSQWLQSTRT